MLTISSVEALREQITQWKLQGNSIGFVPTMGNLHTGHFSLIERARQSADKVVVSVFVNPTQFSLGEDYERYPRTLDADSESLAQHEVDILFTPSVETMYSEGVHAMGVRVPDKLNNMLCGLSRPGHFDGVATVVTKLFNLVQPDVAVFGQKDYQQLAIIRYLVKDLFFPVEIIGHETVRESDGLAMSSRNHYLTQQERQVAGELYKALIELVGYVKNHQEMMRQAIKSTTEQLENIGFMIEYIDIRRQSDLNPVEVSDHLLIALVAAKLGQTRLIDNCLFELE